MGGQVGPGGRPWVWFRKGVAPSRQRGFGGVTPEKILKFYIQNYAFWCIFSGFEQLLDMQSSARQKSLIRWSTRATLFDDRLCHAVQAPVL